MSKKPILILQMQRMGDLILSFPLMLWLARQYPGHPIFVAAEENFYKPLMPVSPPVTYFPWSGVGVLKQHRFELAINLSIREKAARLMGEVHAEEKLGPVRSPKGGYLVHGDWQLYRTSLVKNNRYNRYHWADLNGLDALPYNDMAATRYQTPRTLADSRKIGLFLGASDPAKRPTATFWAALVDELHGRDLRPVLFGGPAEIPLGEEVVKLAKGPALTLCGKLGLDELAAVGNTLGLFITPDTGPMHLAAWTGLKCLNLSMGNVHPYETGPYQPGHYVLRANMNCAKGCWTCTRSRLYCHDPFQPGRVASLARRLLAGAASDKLARLSLPGLTLFQTAKSDLGLYHLDRLDQTAPDEERLASRFWQGFFGNLFGLFDEQMYATAWAELTALDKSAADTLLAHIPEMSRQFRHGFRSGEVLDETFWAESPPVAKPFTGYVHMLLQNEDFSRPAWAKSLEILERLVAACR